MATIAALRTQPFIIDTPGRLLPETAPSYCVTVADAPLSIVAGTVSDAFSAWLQESGARDFTALTAANPHSFALGADANRQRHRSLVRALVFEGVRFVEAVATDFAGKQPAVVVFDLGADRAAALGRAYAQGGVLFGDRRQARFVACEGLEFQI